MHTDQMVPVLTSVVNFLIEELRETRKRTISPQDEWRLAGLLHQSARRSRRLERIAAALAATDAQTPPATD